MRFLLEKLLMSNLRLNVLLFMHCSSEILRRERVEKMRQNKNKTVLSILVAKCFSLISENYFTYVDFLLGCCGFWLFSFSKHSVCELCSALYVSCLNELGKLTAVTDNETAEILVRWRGLDLRA